MVGNAIANGWQYLAIGSMLSAIIDYRGKTPPKSPTGIPCLSAASVKKGKIDLSGVTYVSQETYDRWTTRGFPKAGDVLITTEAPVGEVASFPGDRIYLMTRRIMALRGKEGVLANGFLKYALLCPTHRDRLLSVQRGTTAPRVLKTDITGLEIPVPPFGEQRAIAGVLGALDDKIELNRRMNETLEGLARAVFQSWFVDFDPVRAQRDGLPSPALDQVPTVQQLTDRRILLIGDGYRAKRIELGEPGLPFVRAGNLQDHGFTFDNAEILSEAGVAAAGEKISQSYDVAFTSKGTVGRITLVTPKTRRFIYSPQVCFWRVLDRDAIDPHVLYRWMESAEFMDQVARVKGQTDMAEYVSLRDQRQMRVALPKIEEQRRIAGSLKLIDDSVAANAAQSMQLAAIRDALLPKLLSGEIRVAEAERLVEDAG